jgi:cytosine/adenosine deaminase-related metal-dependent hydrolase
MASGEMREFVIRGGHVMTMEAAAGDVPGGDVHVADGRIVAVGPGLEAPGIPVIDAQGMIVLPGLVETHWHMWNTLIRGMSESGAEPLGYFRISTELGCACLPGDVYQGTRLACAEAIYSGITFVHDWCHNVRGPDYAEAGLRALAESGLRGRFSWGYPAGCANDQPMDLAGLEKLHGEWGRHSAGGRLSLGVAWRGTGGSNPAMIIPPAVYRAEIEAARGLGLPVTVHASGPRTAVGQIRAIAREGLLGPDMQVVHGNNATGEEIGQLAASGASVSMSPFTELLIGYGMTRAGEFLGAGIPAGLSVDTTVLSGNADMFGIMKVTQAVENARARSEFALTSRQVLELATIGGARSMGLGEETGSLLPGKRADIIMVSLDAPNLSVFTDPARLLVTAATPGDVDTVIVDGRVLKRGGRLTLLDPAAIRREAQASLDALLSRSSA